MLALTAQWKTEVTNVLILSTLLTNRIPLIVLINIILNFTC